MKREKTMITGYMRGKKTTQKQKVVKEILQILHDLGGCDATDEWDKGYDAAIDTAYNEIKKRYNIE